MKIVKAINIFLDVDAVKDTLKPLQKKGCKKYVSIEDVREEMFKLEQRMRQDIQAGRSCVGWCAVDTDYMDRKLTESFELIYKNITEEG